MATFRYFSVRLKLLTEQLGTAPEASIYAKHVQEKARKEIAAANRLGNKLSKTLDKYKNVEMSDEKAIEELQGILRAYMEKSGSKHSLSDDLAKLREQAEEIKAEWEAVCGREGSAATVFMRDAAGKVIVSTHMFLGNLKENLRICTSNSTEAKENRIAKSKVAVGEMGALDIKVVEDFVRPSEDIVRESNGMPALLERPIRFERMGKVDTAICRSEYLPPGTEYQFTLRVRATSPLCDEKVLSALLDLGKNNGLGQWRGSGKKGAYAYKIEELPNFKDPSIPAGWN